MKFYELAIGAQFLFRGRRYVKTAMSMTEDEGRVGTILMGETEVTPDGEALLLPPEEAARWKPDAKYWTDYIRPAPGQG